MEKNDLLPGERLDDLCRDNLFIIQSENQFRFGIDAVLLTDFATVKKGERCLDLGTGTGIIPILLSAKTKGQHFCGLEISEYMADMATRSVSFNKLSDKIEIINADIKFIENHIPAATFQVVTSNPPYMNVGGGLLNVSDAKTAARHEVLLSFDDVAKAAYYALIPQGRFYLVHRPHRLADVITSLRSHRLEPKSLQFVHYSPDKEPSLFLLSATKNGNPLLKVLPPLILKNDGF